MKRLVLLPVVAALAFAASAAASPTGVREVVVGHQHGLLLVTSQTGTVSAVRGRASVGTRVLVSSGRVAAAIGRATRASFHGIVVRRVGLLTFFSASGHLLAVHSGGRRLASATDTTPTPGTQTNVTVGFGDQGDLEEQGEQDLGQVSGAIQIQATVASVGTGTVTLTVNGQSLTISLPGGLTLPSSLVGQTVSLSLNFDSGQAVASEGDNQGDGGGD